MLRIFEYYYRLQGLRGQVTQLPTWARFILALAALPGVLLLALSIMAVGVSILALLLLTLPVYRLLMALVGGKASESAAEGTVQVSEPNRRHVNVKIISETAGENRPESATSGPEQR